MIPAFRRCFGPHAQMQSESSSLWVTMLLWLWASFLIGSMLGPLFGPGELFLRDMVVLDHPRLIPSAVGFGMLPARNVPQDGVLALVGMLVPASWFVRVVLLAAGAFGAWCAMCCARTTPAKFAAVAMTLANPFVIERLLQGHWGLVITAWVLPGIYVWRKHPKRVVLLLWVCSLTPTGAVIALVFALCVVRSRLVIVIAGLLSSLPWLVPSLITPSSAGITTVFLGRAEAGVGTLGTFFTLGGLWNTSAVPDSRNAGFATIGLLVWFALVPFIPRRLWLPSLIGIGGFVLLWLGPSTLIFATIPGAQLFRDSSKLALLLIPGLVVATGRFQLPRLRLAPLFLSIMIVAQTPDALVALQMLQPVQFDVEDGVGAERGGGSGVEAERGGEAAGVGAADGQADAASATSSSESGDQASANDAAARAATYNFAPSNHVLLQLDHGGLVRIGDRIGVDPATKMQEILHSGSLVVHTDTGSVVADPINPVFLQAKAAWFRHDTKLLDELGICYVQHQNVVHTRTCPAPYTTNWRYQLGVGLLGLWCLVPVGVALWRRKATVKS
ncbi:hypothetical protein [Corynebacterium sp. HS2168-gen11]|uniref:hypothetical protein n=1 Tax=Corynebacterium sp. HS2168-gen11 TaxID=2974027 RepID=UPI00216B4C76|nr:hypothetical protein [Corynebacterium sp. HS2168-gen11]MCS4535989.1 hypothetical protein [Corynebacterium sp. HS2168-gen11]